jgi:2-dehydropantoate 2-reductase
MASASSIEVEMGKRIAVVGSGAVGGYLGGHLARTGNDVTLIDPWPEHVEAIRARGLQLSGMTDEESCTVKLPTMHLTEVQSLSRQRPVDIAFVCSKSYDTEWSTMLIRPYLATDGFVVSAQNSINEEAIARVVGWGRTVGCIVGNNFGVDLYEPGCVRRTMPRDFDTTFDLRGRNARPGYRTGRGAARHVRQNRRRRRDDQPVGRPLVETVCERHA